MDSRKWHAVPLESIMEMLKTSHQGLTDEEAKKRLQEYGFNELMERKRVTPLQIFLRQFKDIFVIMLLVATGISFLIGETTDAATISAIVVLNSVVGFVQEYRSEKAMEAMKKLTSPKARVLRNGREEVIPAREVVPGDIVSLEAGDRIPADGQLLEVVDIKVDEAVLTGESTPVEKIVGTIEENAPVSERKNSIFMATHVIYGRGKAVITSTGMNTEFGKIAEMVQAMEEEETPLKQKLDRFAKKLGIGVIAICAIIFALELYEIFVLGIHESSEAMRNIISAFETSVALAVSAVPEGLPAVVTVSLTLGARELAKRNAVIRKLSSAETLGATTIICSDKTGTLTKGEMTVRRIFVGGKAIEVTGVGYESKGEFLFRGKKIKPEDIEGLSLLLRAGMLCTNAYYDGKSVIGDTTEGALIVAATKAGMDKKEIESLYPRVHEVPFTSERKRMTTVHKTNDGKLVAYMKGAPEIVLERCKHLLKNGRMEKLDAKEREEILRMNEEMAGDALRVLGIAYRILPETDPNAIEEKRIEEDLVFIGLVGMIDPPREEAKEANQKCQKAGIKTVMITGDHKLTAIAIAKEIGMIKEKSIVLTGSDLDRMSDEEFEKIVEDVSVYARVSPEHKLRIVRALKRRGHIVAMTGDGVNDAPALKQADIGIAMGITGTDVTKEASDMVLSDDNFATIVKAVEGGRTIYDNILKFSFFLLRCNFDELLVIGSFALMGLELPLTAGMILWINLVTDGGPAVALSMDPPANDVMERPPRDPAQGILHGRLASILATFVTQFLGTCVLFYVAYYILGEPLEEARAMAFVQATLQELVIVWNCRSEKQNAFKVGFTNNRFLLIAEIVSVISTLLIPYLGLFGTAPLTILDYLLVVPVSLSGFLILPEVFYGRKIWRWT
ncbi:MAG: cation-translocating P-type ATPase [Thermoproteota archaeon]